MLPFIALNSDSRIKVVTNTLELSQRVSFNTILVRLRVLETGHEFTGSRITEEQVSVTIVGISYLKTHLNRKLRDVERIISPKSGCTIELRQIINNC